MRVKEIEAWDLRYGPGGRELATPDGEHLYYEVRGTGPVVTLVSTIYVVATAWRNFTHRLAERNRIVSYDLRNQGASAETAVPFEQHVTDLLTLLDELEVDSTYLVGTSISTLICRDFAVAHPERVKGIVLVGPAMSPWRRSQRRKRIVRSWLAALEAGGTEGLFDLIFPIVFGDRTTARGGAPAYLALRERFTAMNSHAQLRENLASSLDASDDVALLAQFACPALLMTGDDDFQASRAALVEMLEVIGSGRVDVIFGCGHLPYFEATEAFERSVQDFVSLVEAGELDGVRSVRTLDLRGVELDA